MSSPVLTVLVTGIGGPAGQSLSRQLRGHRVRVIGTDMREVGTSSADVFLTGPRADSASLLPFLRSAIGTYNVDLFIPTVQEELPIVAAASPVLGTRVLMSGPAAVGICHDKLLTALHLRSHGLSVPWTVVGSEPPVKFPLVAKPRVSRGGRGVTVVDTPEHLPESDDALILQGFADGVEYCPQVYRSPIDGTVATVVLQKTRLREGRVGNADAVIRIRREDAPDVAMLAEAAAEALDLRGPVDMDIRRGADGRPQILEINARFGANSSHAPELLSQLLADAALIAPSHAPAAVAEVG